MDGIAQAEEARRTLLNLVWVWLVLSLCMVAFADQLGYLWVRQPDGRGYGWSPESAHGVAQTFRSVGTLLFGAGVVERVLIKCGK